MKYCCEDISKIENYELAKRDNFRGWVIHHRLELVETGAVVDSTMQDLKARAGRDVKLTNKDTKIVLYARIRELEKRVKVLEAEVTELKEFKEEATEEIREIKEKVEKFDNLDDLVAKTTIKTFKKMLYDYCAAERNNLTYEKVKEWGLLDAFLLALKSNAITKAVDGDYYFIHWNEIKSL